MRNFWTDLAWDRNNLIQEDTMSSVPLLIGKDMLRESISKMKDGKAATSSGLASEIVNAAGEAGADMMTDLVNQIIVGAAPTEWQLTCIANFF